VDSHAADALARVGELILTNRVPITKH